MNPNNFTHKKRPYKAFAIQWNGHNTDDVFELLSPFASVCIHKYGKEETSNEYIMIRFNDKLDGRPSIYTMSIGEWVVMGENGKTKCYTDEVFKVKYEEL